MQKARQVAGGGILLVHRGQKHIEVMLACLELSAKKDFCVKGFCTGEELLGKNEADVA